MKFFHLFLRLALLPSSSLPQLPFCCSFPSSSWSTPLSCTLRVPVQCVSFYCSLWFTYCMADPTPFSLIYLLFNRCLFCSLPQFLIWILSGHLTFKKYHRHQFTNTWSELLIHFIIFHDSHLYNRTDLTFVSNNWILVLRYFYSSEMGTTAQRPHLPSWILLDILFKLSRYVKNLTCSTSLPFIVNTRYVLGYVVAQLVEALRYKLECRGFDSRWCH